jgi:glycosyltransferase involved in cell wall biosynthesis
MFKHAAVLIPTYNSQTSLTRCLAALREQSCPDFEIVVVDDGSQDGSADYLAALSWQRLKWQRLSENKGRSAARNQAIALAEAPLLIFLDSDMVVNCDFVAAHLHFHRQHGEGWIGQGRVIISHDYTNPTLTPFSPWTDASRAFFATGNVSVAKAAVEKARGFDLAFRDYGWEDLELGLRLRQEGLKSRPVPEAVSYHLEPPFDLADWPVLIAKEQARARGAWHLYQKHPSLEVRLMTQLTPLHRWLDALLRLGGRVDEASVLRALQKMQQRGQAKMALALARAYLNHYYLQELAETQSI